MKISVIVPVYNSEIFLHKCISSILNQTYTNIELILIDDGSTDSSASICDSFAKNEPRIKVVHQKNSGVSEARNRGLDIAKGDYITFVDSDDYIESSMYEALINLSIKYGAEITHCGYKRVDTEGTIHKEVNGTHKVLCQDPIVAVNSFLQGDYFNCGIWNKLFKADLFNDIRFNSNLKINEDVLVGFLAFQKASRIVFIDETYYCYVIHKGSACNTVDEEKKILDVIEATDLMINSCKYEENRIVLSARLFKEKLQLYRWYVFNRNSSVKAKRIQLRKELKKIKEDNRLLDRRSKMNYYLMLYFEPIYKIFYMVYDRIRTPNWDPEI